MNPYDLVPYDCRAISLTHPARLATAALLKGHECAPPDRARILELGCGDGANLMPMAVSYPESQLLGIDNGRVQIDAGLAVRDQLGLGNLELRCADIESLDDSIGRFDYILVHGVYSWVTDEVREAILARIAASLSERGVAYLSYNTLPGWGLRGALRDVLRLRIRGVRDPRAQIEAARAHLTRLLELRAGSSADPYAALMTEMLQRVLSAGDAYLLHEYLTEHNRAFSVVDVMEALERHGLRSLDELTRATVSKYTDDRLRTELYRAELPADEVEASADLLTFRQFRATLLTRASETPPRFAHPRLVVESCEIAGALRPAAAEAWLDDETEQKFETPQGVAVGARTPLLKAALTVLGRTWPQSIRFDSLIDRSRALLAATVADPPETSAQDAETTVLDLLHLRAMGYLELRAFPPTMVTRVSRNPLVSPLTRLDAARNRPVTSQLHLPITLDPLSRALARCLDGGVERAEIGAILQLPGELGEPSDSELEGAISRSFLTLAKNGLLVG